MKERLLREFAERFGNAEGAQVYFAPGRVNLIGEHTDYNGGHVFPCALDIGTYAVVRKRQDKRLFFYSMNYPEAGIINSSLNGQLEHDDEDGWANYPKGVIWAFEEKGMQLACGFEMMVYGNLPSGAGLSSSASLEVLTGWALRDIFEFEVSDQEIALISQHAENTFNGVRCGVMDQFAVAMGRAHQAIYLNTENLSYRYVPVQLQNMQLIISCTNKERGLADSRNITSDAWSVSGHWLIYRKLYRSDSLVSYPWMILKNIRQRLLTMSAEGVQGMLFQRMRGPFRLCRLWRTMI